MSVFREIKLSYKGKDYDLTPSNRLLRKIERELSLTDMIARIGEAKPPISEIAFVASEFLKAAGAGDVDEDEMHQALMADVMNGGDVFQHMCEAIVLAISPPEDIAKKPEPRKRKGAKAKAE